MAGVLPAARLDYHVALAVEQIETPGKPRRDFGDEALHDVFQVVHRVATLQPLRHPRQQVAHRAVGVAFAFQPLPFQPVFAENADRLRHVADLVDLVEGGRLGGEVLRRQPVDHVAQLDDRAQYPLLEDEIEHAQHQQRGQRQCDFGNALPQPRHLGRGIDLRLDPCI